MNYFIGIDPGLKGGLCLLDENGSVENLLVMPVMKIGTKNTLDIKVIIAWFEACKLKGPIIMVALEKQQAMSKQGVTSTFNTGRGFGLLEGIISTLSIPYRVIRAVDWQKEMFKGLPKAKGMTKVHSALIAQQLFPKMSFKASDRCTNLHDGLTDAVLIGEYIRRETK